MPLSLSFESVGGGVEDEAAVFGFGLDGLVDKLGVFGVEVEDRDGFKGDDVEVEGGEVFG